MSTPDLDLAANSICTKEIINMEQGTVKWFNDAKGFGFISAYKVGGGLVVDVKKDTHFTFEQTKVNGEVWLPARIDAQGAFRALLFISFNGSLHVTESDYRKFRATATVLPGVTPVAPAEAPAPQP